MTTFGAIRWDATYAEVGDAETNMENNLSPAEFQLRAPFWARSVATNLVRFDSSRATMEAEIERAVEAGIDYWAFLLYNRSIGENPTSMMNGYDLFQQAGNKGDINWCMIRQSNDWGSTGNYAAKVAEAVAQVQQSNDQKVLTNRPLVFGFNANDGRTDYWGGSFVNFKAAIDAFRAAVQVAGLGNPYVVAMSSESAALAGTDKTGIGADAAAMYSVSIQTTLTQPFSTLQTYVTGTSRPNLVTAATKIIPTVVGGSDRRPRIKRPVYWEAASQRPFFGLNRYTVPPTPSEMQAAVEDALTYVASNPSTCEADTVICYAWNEFDEGGYLCPTLGDPAGALLDAVAAALA